MKFRTVSCADPRGYARRCSRSCSVAWPRWWWFRFPPGVRRRLSLWFRLSPGRWLSPGLWLSRVLASVRVSASARASPFTLASLRPFGFRPGFAFRGPCCFNNWWGSAFVGGLAFGAAIAPPPPVWWAPPPVFYAPPPGWYAPPPGW